MTAAFAFALEITRPVLKGMIPHRLSLSDCMQPCLIVVLTSMFADPMTEHLTRLKVEKILRDMEFVEVVQFHRKMDTRNVLNNGSDGKHSQTNCYESSSCRFLYSSSDHSVEQIVSCDCDGTKFRFL